MRTVDLILRKRGADELSVEEIQFLVNGYTTGEIPDYQMAAFLMATYFSGMTDRELSALTESMMQSGETISLADIPGVKVDKHSTGGVGDKTSLICAPIAAAVGVNLQSWRKPRKFLLPIEEEACRHNNQMRALHARRRLDAAFLNRSQKTDGLNGLA